MAGKNSTGIPRTSDYLLGRGTLYYAELDGSGNPKDWRDLGNVTDFKVTVESEELVHESSRTGLKIEDASVTLKRAQNWSATIDTIENDNVAMFTSATQATVTNPAVAGFSEHAMVASVVLGRWYDVVNASGARAYDLDKTKLTLEKSGSPDVALVENTDFTVDEKMGRIFLLSTASNIAAGDTLDVTLAADAGAAAVYEVRALQKTSQVGALKFVGEDPNSGEKYEVQIHKTNVEGDGEMAFVSDDWITLGLKGKVQKSDSTRFTASPYMTYRTIAV